MNNPNNKIDEIKSLVQDALTEYFQSAKEKSIDAEKAVVKYVTGNPLKAFGIAATAGLLLSCFCKCKSK